jgi:pyridoxal phosphate enzyme (YggS family)
MPKNLEDRVALVRERMVRACGRAGRNPDNVTLIAVSKTHSAERVRELMRTGIVHLGENKVQEAAGKITEIGSGHWHLIGHLQSNKARQAVLLFDSVDSVDSLALGSELSKRAVLAERRLRILIEVNVSGEGSKFGVKPAEAEAVALALGSLPQIHLAGLMTVPPFFREVEKTRIYFQHLRQLRDSLEKNTGLFLPVLSMGMSHDFEIAIEEGATEVRVGSALFGEREYVIKPRPVDL